MILVLIVGLNCIAISGASNELKGIFAKEIAEIVLLKDQDIPNPNYQVLVSTKDIISLGPPVISYVYDELRSGDVFLSPYMCAAMQALTKKIFVDEGGRIDERNEYYSSYAELWINWWEIERFQSKQQFNSLYDQWKHVPQEKRFQKLAAVDFVATYASNPQSSLP